MSLHQYDPGAYSLILFDVRGRRRPRKLLLRNFTAAQRACNAWTRRAGGSAVILRCLYNTQLGRPAYPPEYQ